jgi:hypothetical protein
VTQQRELTIDVSVLWSASTPLMDKIAAVCCSQIQYKSSGWWLVLWLILLMGLIWSGLRRITCKDDRKLPYECAQNALLDGIGQSVWFGIRSARNSSPRWRRIWAFPVPCLLGLLFKGLHAFPLTHIELLWISKVFTWLSQCNITGMA